MQEIFDFVEKFMSLSAAEKDLIQKSNVKRCYKKNEIVANISVANDESFFVLKGAVGSFYSRGEKEIASEFFFQGEPILVAAVSDPDIETRHLRCLENSELAVSSAIEGARLMLQFPRFERVCRQFAEVQMLRSMKFNDRLRVLSPIQKYEFIAADRPELITRVPQHILAGYLGMAPETLSRLRGQIARR